MQFQMMTMFFVKTVELCYQFFRCKNIDIEHCLTMNKKFKNIHLPLNTKNKLKENALSPHAQYLLLNRKPLKHEMYFYDFLFFNRIYFPCYHFARSFCDFLYIINFPSKMNLGIFIKSTIISCQLIL